MKNKIIIITLIIISLIIININLKKEEKVQVRENLLSIIIEKEDGNVKSETFPSKDIYNFSRIECTNNSDTSVVPTFNESTWKLNIKASSNTKVDGNLYCSVYFKEKDCVEDNLLLRYDAHTKPVNNKWKDLSGNNNDGVLYYIDSTSGWKDNYMHFDGIDDYVMSENNVGLSGDASLSMCATAKWVGTTWEDGYKGSYGAFPAYMGIAKLYTNNYAGLALTYGKISMDFWNYRYLSNEAAIEIGKTYYICVTKTPGNISTTSKIYVNASEVLGTGNNTGSPNIVDSQAVVGRLDSYRYSTSHIMEVQYYNKALSESEIKFNYEKAKKRHNF